MGVDAKKFGSASRRFEGLRRYLPRCVCLRSQRSDPSGQAEGASLLLACDRAHVARSPNVAKRLQNVLHRHRLRGSCQRLTLAERYSRGNRHRFPSLATIMKTARYAYQSVSVFEAQKIKDATMIKFVIASSVALAIVTPAVAQNSRDQYRGNQNGGSTFDSIDPLRTDPGSTRGRYTSEPYGRRSGSSNGASSGERGTFDSGPNDPPPPFTPQREGGR